MSIAQGIISRWDAAGLNATVAMLHRGNPDDDLLGAVPEDIQNWQLPRAEFWVDDDSQFLNTAGSMIRRGLVTFRVYHKEAHTLEGLLDRIEAAMNRSQSASASPLTIPDGDVILMQFSSRNLMPVDEAVFAGTVTFDLTWQKSLPFAVA